MEKKKRTIWGIVKSICQVLFCLFVVFAGVWGIVYLFPKSVNFVVMVDDWVKCKTAEFLCLRSRWDVIKDISWDIIVSIFVLFSVVMVVMKIKNNNIKITWAEVKEIWQIVRKVLVVGFLSFVGAVGLLLFALLIAVLFDACIECWAKIILGISENMTKQDVIKFIGWGITGILAFFGAVAINSRANAQIQIAKAEVESNKLIERGHVQERFKAAAEHLGSEHEWARAASFYEFYHLALDNKNLRKSVLDMLCAHLRQITTSARYEPKKKFIASNENLEIITDEKNSKGMKPTEEVQSLLDVLFQFKGGQRELIFIKFSANLQRVFLMKASLLSVNLQRADLYEADLRGAELLETDFRYARLFRVDFRKAYFYETNLRNAWLGEAKFQRAWFCRVDFRKASLWGANFYGVDLEEADLQGANLKGADLRGANLERVKNLETVNLSKAKVKGAKRPKGFEWPDDVVHD